MDINWFPGHMAKALRNIEEHLPLVDVVIETADARIPSSSRNPELKKRIRNKPHILVLNKSDLADPIESKLWIEHYQAEGLKAIDVNAKDQNNLRKIRDIAFSLAQEKLDRIEAKGRSNRPLRIMLVGIPNTGKSTIINALSARRAANTENRPGVTRGPQWVKTKDFKMELLDMPGVLWPKLETNEEKLSLASTGAIKDHVLPMEELAFFLFKKLCEKYPELIEARYKIDLTPSDMYELYLSAARRRGCIMSGGRVDEARFSELLINEFRNGSIGRITLETVQNRSAEVAQTDSTNDGNEDFIIGSY